MSADNWTYCPRCDMLRAKQADERSAELTRGHGEIPPEEYLKLVEAPLPREETLREDYEIGIHKGKFSVSYRAGCKVCGFVFEFPGPGCHPINLEVE